MEVQTTQKTGRKPASKKQENAAAATTSTTNVVENTVAAAVETTNEKKTRGKKAASATTSPIVNEEASPIQNEETIEASPENGDEVMSDAQEVLANMSVLSEQIIQLYAKFKTVKEFDSEFSKQFKKTFSKIERGVNEIDGHFSDVLVKIQTAGEKLAGKKQRKSKTASPSSENKVHAVNTPKLAHPFVVKAMKLADGTHVSRTDVQKFIGNMIKAHKDDEYKVVVNGETQKSLFHINKGELGEFFKNIQAEFDKNGATEHEKKMGYVDANGKLPTQISYKMLMGYYSKCFPPSTSA